MRLKFQPVVLVAAIGGFALGRYTPAVIAQTSGGSDSGGGTKKEMSCETALEVAKVAIAVSTVLTAGGGSSAGAFFAGYAMGVIAAACPSPK